VNTVGRKRTKKVLAPFGERLRIAIERSPIKNRSAFTTAAPIQPAQLYRYETGEQSPRLEDVERWAELLGVSPAWLAYDDGDAAEPDVSPQDAELQAAAAKVGLDADGLRTLRKIRALLGQMTEGEILTSAERLRK
jgi:transcriptional regulator with XRE-family HTH domain